MDPHTPAAIRKHLNIPISLEDFCFVRDLSVRTGRPVYELVWTAAKPALELLAAELPPRQADPDEGD